MYDIQIKNTENFIANGMVSHNCFINQGVSANIREKLLLSSDNYTAPVCDSCGLIAIRKKGRLTCKNCFDNSNFHNIRFPYSCKLMFQELQAMGIVSRIRMNNKL
jgi:DNA-directed RNA polymerase beta subunit